MAKLYYEQNKTQAEIAAIVGVSRPMISRMLDEARYIGIVEVQIHSPSQIRSAILDKVREVFSLKGGALVADGADDISTNNALGRAAIDLVRGLGGGHIGLGWGHIIGTIVSIFEADDFEKSGITDVCPMVGNSGVPIRNYHSNENTRIVASRTGAAAHYLYSPALAETRQELELILQTEQYKAVLREWERLDIALVNIGNHPSTPDFASGARFGTLLSSRKAVGRIIAYYFNVEGEIIHSDQDYAIQIPIDVLRGCGKVVGICSAGINRRALEGALRTGIFTHIVARENLVQDTLEY